MLESVQVNTGENLIFIEEFKMQLKEMLREGMSRIHLDHERGQ
jgi:hypothetical protein